MILQKKLTSKEVLEALTYLALQNLPKHLDGKIEAFFEGEGVTILFTEYEDLKNMS